ncbi:MAG: hypothetical protein HQ483_17000 [Rhodospirillales bacterium]|nr:hypothetical protein [Rhodospirillales bacterium]
MSNQPSIQKPSKVTRAQERLQDAVLRLEKAIEGRSTGAPGPVVAPVAVSVAAPVVATSAPEAADGPQLIALQDEITRLRQENAALKRVHEQVSSRLDAAIGRLGATLGE